MGVQRSKLKLFIGKSYKFNSETGYYSLAERTYYDPSTLDYGNDDYYLCGSSIKASSDNSLTYWDGASCSIMYKISGLATTSDSEITLSEGDKIATKQYTFKVYKMYETELESDKSDKGIYQSTDNDGITYFYRGNISNNYVKFADNYWKVVRINGDGSIRLIYNGSNQDSTQNIGKYRYNSLSDLFFL